MEKFDYLKGVTVEVLRTDGGTHPVKGVCGGIRPDGMLDVAGEAVPAGEAHVLFERPPTI